MANPTRPAELTTIPFMGRLKDIPSGILITQFRGGEICVICQEGAVGSEGILPECCLEFAIRKNIGKRVCQEFARLLPFLHDRLKSRGEGRHIFHRACLQGWVQSNPTCPYDRREIHVDSFLSTGEKLKKEVSLKPGPWMVIAGFVGIFAGTYIGHQVLGMRVKDAENLGWAVAVVSAVGVYYFARLSAEHHD